MRTRALVAAAVISATVGCYKVRPVWEPEEFLAHANPEVVYVRTSDPRQLHKPPTWVAQPRLTGDTLRGTGENGGSVAVAWADVMDVYAKQIDGTRTAAAVIGMSIFTGLIVYSLVQNADGEYPPPCSVPGGSYDHDRDPECSRPI